MEAPGGRGGGRGGSRSASGRGRGGGFKSESRSEDKALGKQSYRKVEVASGDKSNAGVKADPPSKDPAPAPFRSSLRASIQTQPPPAPADTERKGERHVVVERGSRVQSNVNKSPRDRSRDSRGGNRRTASPARSVKGAESAVTERHERRVISLSSPDREQQVAGAKPFVSSLASSLRDQNKRESPRRQKDRGSCKSFTSSRNDAGSSRRSSSRDSRDGRYAHGNRDHSPQPAYRRVEREGDNRATPLTRPTLSRKNSTDSISSQRSDRSDRNPRWDRRRPDSRSSSRRSSPLNDRNRPRTSDPHERPGIGSSLRDRGAAGPGLRRLSSGSLGASSPAPTRLQSNKSIQDVRFQGRMDASRNARHGDDLQPRRTSLDGATPGLRRTTSLGARSISHDVRADGRPGPPNVTRVVGPDSHSPGRLAEKPGQSGEAERLPMRSSLTESIKQDNESGNANTSEEHSEASEADRKKLAEKLRERMESRNLGRGKSLAELMSRSASIDDHRTAMPRGLANADQKSREAPSEKEARAAEYFAKLDRENAKREQAGRVVGFQSSLKTSVNAPGRVGMGSSLRASITAQPRAASSLLVEKIKYSIAELRRLMAFALPRPADLPDMRITEVFQVRDPSSVPSRRRGGRGGSGGPQGRSIGSSISRRDRETRGGRQAQRGQGGAGSRGKERRGGGGGRGRNQPPPPPLFDGPVEPLTVSENRWVPKKAQEGPVSVLSQVKSLLNKLTREKFKKLTDELCNMEITTLAVLRLVVSCIMDKALEEPSFADVYADLCKEFGTRMKSKRWAFLHSMADTGNSEAYRWIALNGDRLEPYAGPFGSAQECIDAAASNTEATSSCNYAALTSETFHYNDGTVVVVGEKEKGSFYYAKISAADLQDDEPIGGPFETADKARQEALHATSFTEILVTRCQSEFEKTSKHSEPEPTDEEMDERQRNILAMRAKRKMLGNMRFLGELFKVGILKQNVIQDCIFQLLGLELIPGEEVHAQAIRFPDEEDLEALCKMLATVGKKFDRADTKTIMKIIILRLVELSEDKKLNSRSRFLIQDVLEMRDHMWEPRRKELQQKTLEEVRREAQKLQQQGKNAQHDNLTQRRRKTQISSIQLARESSNLIVARTETEPSEPDHEIDEEEEEEAEEIQAPTLDPAQMRNRIKSIIKEYISIVDMEEAAACVRELPIDPFHPEFAEEAINVALDGKENERELAVDLLAGLYRSGALSADAIQQAIVSVMEFLEDMRIDIPHIHQYSALVFGRLIASGCFGLSWMVNDALRHLIDSKLTSMIFPEVLTVVESETNEQTVVRMLNDEELTAASVLPRSMRSESQVEEYLRANGIEDFFNGGRGSDVDEEDDLDPEVAGKMRSTIDEYISVMDLDEVVRCIEELEGVPDCWMHFAHTLVMVSIEAKADVRLKAGELLAKLAERKHVTADDAETAMEFVLEDFEDLLIDIPQLGDNLGELLAPLFQSGSLSLSWFREAGASLVAGGHAAKLLSAVLSAMERLSSREAVVAWWGKQDASQQQGVWKDFASGNSGSSLDAWRQLLQQ